MKRCFACVVVLFTVALFVLPAQTTAAAPSTPASTLALTLTVGASSSGLTATQVLTGTPPLTGSVRIATLLADYFDREVEEILALHADEIGFGMIAKALFTAVEANVPLEQILDMRLQEIGWGEIRKELGLPPGMPHASLGEVISQGRGHKGPDWTPPGQSKKGEGDKGSDWTPPGQLKKIDSRTPPGQSRPKGKP